MNILTAGDDVFVAAPAQEDISACIVPVTMPSAIALCGRAELLPPTPYAHTPWLPSVQGLPGHIYPRVSAHYVTHSMAHYHYPNISHTSYNQLYLSPGTQPHLSPSYSTQPHLSQLYTYPGSQSIASQLSGLFSSMTNCSVNISPQNFIVNTNPQKAASVEWEFDSLMENYEF